MIQAKHGDTVKVHYKGSLENSEVFDMTESDSPIEFTLGKGELIEGFEKAVIGMKKGETRTIIVPPEEAYGDYDEDLRKEFSRTMFPKGFEADLGLVMELSTPDGGSVDATIVEIKDTTITLDANDPLAGKALNFTIELVDIL